MAAAPGVVESLRAAEEHRAAGRLSAARDICRAVLGSAPNDARALHLLGLITLQDGDPQAAVALVERAIKARRNEPQYHRTMGIALRWLGEFDAAIAHFQRALRLKPADYHSHSEIGKALYAAGRPAEAVTSLQRAAALSPTDPDAHFHLGMALLLSGDFERGWAEYEFRPARSGLQRSALPAPEWGGEEVSGKSVVVYGEQGYGDTIQFARYAALLAARGAGVTLVARPELLPLLESLPGVTCVAQGNSLPAADYWCALGSLPRLFDTRLDSVPAAAPYLAPPPRYVERWRGRLAGEGMRVGLVWAGSPTHTNDRNRSMPFAAFAGLSAVSGISLYSLQKGPATAQIAGTGPAVTPLGDELLDFADTAAALQQLDLLISVDTSTAHLAGALARPTLLLLPTGPDWRWLTGRSDSPWYPTLKLIRQSVPGDWTDVVRRVAADLAERSAAAARV